MLQVLEELSLLSVTAIVVAIVLAAALVYALVQWLPARRRNTERALAQELAQVRTEPVSANPAGVSSTDTLPNPRTAAKVRVGREDNRPSEDDIARERMGARGRPGEPAPAPALDESITQIPKHLDPGHTA
jgi:hypothetical protein